MTGGIEEHAHAGLRLILRQDGSRSERMDFRCLEVVDLNIEVANENRGVSVMS